MARACTRDVGSRGRGFVAGGRRRGRCGAAGERSPRLDPAFGLSRRGVSTLASALRAQPESGLHAWIRPSGSAGERLTRLGPAFGLSRRAAYTLGSGLRAQPESAFHVCIEHSGSAKRGSPRWRPSSARPGRARRAGQVLATRRERAVTSQVCLREKPTCRAREPRTGPKGQRLSAAEPHEAKGTRITGPPPVAAHGKPAARVRPPDPTTPLRCHRWARRPVGRHRRPHGPGQRTSARGQPPRRATWNRRPWSRTGR